MANIKLNKNTFEFTVLGLVYFLLALNAFVLNDSKVAVISAFFGITYTFLAGKGRPCCYLFGLAGSAFYCWLSYSNAFWGNLALYALYYIPMQILGFFKWNSNLKQSKNEVVKTKLAPKERVITTAITIFFSILAIALLNFLNDKNPVIDGITTTFSITGMYLTVRRMIEQWQIWIVVNGLSAIMWGLTAIGGVKVYSTVVMWITYFLLAIYFYYDWKKELGA